MILQRNFINMYIILVFCFLSFNFSQIKQPEKPQSPIRIESMDDERIHDLHQYLIINKSLFNNHKTLMVHPEYYVYLKEILKKLDEVIFYNIDQPVIDKKILEEIGLEYEDIHFVDYHQLRTQIKNKIIHNKIKAIEK
tara:strand:+ start:61 stop:474 length:414 start_codon:yes stop_codon:yes gene_type:complete